MMSKKARLFTVIIILLVSVSSTFATQAANDNIVWLLEPELDYDKIYYCAPCNLLGEGKYSGGIEGRISLILDTLDEYSKIYGKTFYISEGHGFDSVSYYYDAGKNIFKKYTRGEGGGSVMSYTSGEFNDVFGDSENLIAVQQADADSIVLSYEEIGPFFDTTKTNGKFALMYKGKLITDFIFDDFYNTNIRFFPFRFVNIIKNGKHGVVNHTGKAAIPFIFEDIEFIDDDIALAKYNGKYGIIDVSATIGGFENYEEATDGFMVDSKIVLICGAVIISAVLIVIVIVLIKKNKLN